MLAQIIQKLRQINLEETALRVVGNEIHVALDLNTEDQLFERGIDSRGNSLGEYSPFTIRVKQAKGQRYDHVTLNDEGDFHRGFTANTKKFPITFTSTDSKTDLLADKYGDDIFGLTPDSTEKFTEHTNQIITEEAKAEVIQAFR